MTDPTTAPAATPRGPAPWWWPQMRDVLAVASTGLFAAALLAPMIVHVANVDPDFKGALIIQWGLAMGYYFGTSKSSVGKDSTIASMAANTPPAT